MGSDFVNWDFLKFTLGVVGIVFGLMLGILGWFIRDVLRDVRTQIVALRIKVDEFHDFKIRVTTLYPKLGSMAVHD